LSSTALRTARDRCVDLFQRPDDTCGFEEFRRDVEDVGVWTPVQYYSSAVYPSKEAVLGAAVKAVVWLVETPVGETVRQKARACASKSTGIKP